MSVVVVRLALAAYAAAGVSACLSGGGQIEANWTGADTGRVASPAEARWCAAGSYIDIRATRGDTAIGIAIFAADTPLSGRYKLIDTLADSVRPVAAVGLRWSKRTVVNGFHSDSGTVVLRREPDGDLAGEFTAKGGLLGGDRRLAAAGRFRNLTLRPAPEDCPLLFDHSRVDFLDGSNLLQERLRAQRRGRGDAQPRLPQLRRRDSARP